MTRPRTFTIEEVNSLIPKLSELVEKQMERHEEIAVTGHTDDGLFGMRKLNAHRRVETETHGAQTTGVDPAARLVELVELRGEQGLLDDRHQFRWLHRSRRVHEMVADHVVGVLRPTGP